MTKRVIKKTKKLHSRKEIILKDSYRKNKEKNTLAKLILLAVAILGVVLVFLLMFMFGVFEPEKEEKLFEEQDACSLVMGNIIHQIRDSGDCQIRCRNDCSIREMEFVRSEFITQENSCHECDCYCR